MVEVARLSSARPLVGRAAVATPASGFVVAEPGGEPGPAAESTGGGALAPASLAGLLALQESAAPPPPGAARDRAARRHGRALLEALRALQRGLLRGAPDLAALRSLAEQEVAEAADPGLRAILAEITLRARVEWARHGGG